MRLLLDTHTFLWYVRDARELSEVALSLIEDPVNEKLLSVASVWEIAIKVSIGKLTLNRPFEDLKAELIDGNGFGLLPVEFNHMVVVSALPFHHKDPFDRLIIAQSQADGIPVIGADKTFDSYGVTRFW